MCPKHYINSDEHANVIQLHCSLVTEMNAEMQISQGDCGESKEKIAKQYELFFTQEADNLTKHLRSNKLDGKVKLCEFFEVSFFAHTISIITIIMFRKQRVHGIIQQQIISIVQGAVPPLFQLSASPRKLPLKDLSRAYARLLVSQNLTLQCPPVSRIMPCMHNYTRLCSCNIPGIGAADCCRRIQKSPSRFDDKESNCSELEVGHCCAPNDTLTVDPVSWF